MSAYYNEFDPKAAATLRELIAEGLIAPGDVDERSIEDVLPSEIAGYTQVHLFAGFGIWSLAFRMAGWPDSRPVWSASFPCQPFSAAGKGNGFADERHLWPSGFWLLQHGKRPDVPIYGEQVASPDGLTWLDLVRADLETIKHSCWYTVLASAGFGAPIIRQRTYWMAFSNGEQHDGRGESGERRRSEFSDRRHLSGLGKSQLSESEGQRQYGRESLRLKAAEGSPRGCLDGKLGLFGSDPRLLQEHGAGSLASANLDRPQGSPEQTLFRERRREEGDEIGCSNASLALSDRGTGPTNGFWRNADWLRCRDDKWRPVEPGTLPLAHGYPERVGILRGAGNAISPQVAAAWITVTM